MGKTQLTQAVQTFFGVRKELLIGSSVMGPECTDDAVEGYARWARLDGQPYAGSDWIEAVADSLLISRLPISHRCLSSRCTFWGHVGCNMGRPV